MEIFIRTNNQVLNHRDSFPEGWYTLEWDFKGAFQIEKGTECTPVIRQSCSYMESLEIAFSSMWLECRACKDKVICQRGEEEEEEAEEKEEKIHMYVETGCSQIVRDLISLFKMIWVCFALFLTWQLEESFNETHILEQYRKQCWGCRLYEENIRPGWGSKEAVTIMQSFAGTAFEGWITQSTWKLPGQSASAGWASSCTPKDAGLIPHQGPCLGCKFDPQMGHVQKAIDHCFSHPSLSQHVLR